MHAPRGRAMRGLIAVAIAVSSVFAVTVAPQSASAAPILYLGQTYSASITLHDDLWQATCSFTERKPLIGRNTMVTTVSARPRSLLGALTVIRSYADCTVFDAATCDFSGPTPPVFACTPVDGFYVYNAGGSTINRSNTTFPPFKRTYVACITTAEYWQRGNVSPQVLSFGPYSLCSPLPGSSD